MVVQSKNNEEIVLIRSSSVLSHGMVSSVSGSPPLGIAYLASYLRKKGFHSIGIIDGFGEAPLKREIHSKFDIVGLTNEEIVERIPHSVKIIGFSCMFSNEWVNLKTLIKLVRARFPRVVIVLGG